MKKLRHPINSITEPFGKAGLTVAILALVMAMVGGAYAAGGLTKSQEKQVKKIAKKYAGKPGANGANGSNGATGPKGDPGTAGSAGTAGISVTTKAIPTSSSTCSRQGGTEFTSASGTEKVCNGQTGFTETLPAGKTETGEWSLVGDAYSQGELEFEEGKEHLSEEVILKQAGGSFKHFATAVSFNIPLEQAPVAHYIRTSGLEPIYNGSTEEEVVQPECPGNAAEPAAEPGNLCVYASAEENTARNPLGAIILPKLNSFASGGINNVIGPNAADPYGFGVFTLSKEAGPVDVVGTWAVTAAE